MSKKTITTILAVIGALTAVGALLYFFRDKLCGLCGKCECCCEAEDEDPIGDAVEEAKQTIAETVEEAKEAITEHAEEKAAAIVEEFKDYAD